MSRYSFLFYSALLKFVFTEKSSAQNKNYEDEYRGGYRGGFIKDLQAQDSAVNFLVIGDWGRCGEYFQKEVAEQLSFASVSVDASFIISTGDNFYPKGVASIDDPLWTRSFEDVYHHYSLQKEWYAVLGNHDYKTNPQAEIDYSKKNTRWTMPSHYYSKKIAIDGDTNQKILFVFIDTNPLIDKYYSEDSEFGKHIRAQDSLVQKKWLIRTLSDPDPTIRWRFVIGHHPLYTSGKRIKSPETLQFRESMKGIFDKYNVDAYICGHEHQLEYIKPEGKTHYFISGSGSEVREVKGQLPESRFKASDHGFTGFSVTKKKVNVFMINWEGKIIYNQLLKN